MRTPLLVGVVVGIHCVAVGSVVLIQGCRATMQGHKAVEAPVVAETPVVTETTEIKAPAPVPQAVPPVAEKTKIEHVAPVETTTYVVAEGDSLSTIAYKYGLKGPEIMALNCMTNPNRIKAGQKLRLPGKVNIDAPKRQVVKKVKAAEEAPAGEEAGAVAGSAVEYTVAKGDILSRIAVKHGTTVAAIKKANNLTSDKLRAGQKLMVPGGVKKASEAAAEVSTEEKTDADTAAQSEPAGTTAPAPVAAPAAPQQAPAPAGQTGVSVPVSAPVKAGSSQTYTVEPNDDIVKIAKMWGVKAEDIKKANNITDDAPLKPGKVLTIPINAE